MNARPHMHMPWEDGGDEMAMNFTGPVKFAGPVKVRKEAG